MAVSTSKKALDTHITQHSNARVMKGWRQTVLRAKFKGNIADGFF